jgi:hypothetical protein
MHKSSTWRHRSRRLGFEQFESRRLMAVTTVQDGNGTLSIIGDATADDIAIVGTGVPGQVTVTGRNGTLVDGAVSVTKSAVTGSLNIGLGDGNNVLNIDNVYIADSINLLMGTGNDNITLGATSPVSPANDLTINTGAGHDVVNEDTTIYNVFVGRNNIVVTGAGNDNVRLFGASAGGSIYIDGEAEGDTILANGVTAAGALAIHGSGEGSGGGPGANILAVLFTSAQQGITVDSVSGGQIYIDIVFTPGVMRLGSANGLGMNSDGNLELGVFRCNVGQLVINGAGGEFDPNPESQGGNDRIRVVGNQIGYLGGTFPGAALTIITGAGAENIEVSNNVVTSLAILLGDTFDFMELRGNRVEGGAFIDGGNGSDSLNSADNQFGSVNVVNFP